MQELDYGIRMQNEGQSNYWEIFHWSDSDRLALWNTNGNKGYFDYDDGQYHNVSDRRLKENINPLKAVLPSLMLLQAKNYTMKTDKDKKPRIGFIAQELEQVFPELVTPPSISNKGETNYMVNYGGFGVLAIKAIQEQQTIIEAQAAKIEAQQTELDAIKKALAKAGIKLD